MRSRVGTLEADHAMVGLNQRLADDPTFAAAYADAHERYVAFRDTLGEPLPGDPGAAACPARQVPARARRPPPRHRRQPDRRLDRRRHPGAVPRPCVPEELLRRQIRRGAGG
jgi:hypothetical protein